MRKYVKAYVLVRQTLALILTAAAFALALVLILNLITTPLSGYRVWFESHAIGVAVVVLLVLITSWSRLMPTLRTVFRVRRSTSGTSFTVLVDENKRLLVLALTGLALLLFACTDVNEPIMKHPARYGYFGDMLLGVALLVYISKLSAPPRARIDRGLFVSDDPRDRPKLTESQLQAAAYLEDILASGMPRSVALTGDWGAGKTAVYRRAREGAVRNHPDIIWVDFDPWRYASEEALVKGFYESIAKQIDDEVPGFQNALRSMAHSVDQLVSKSDSSGVAQAISGLAKGTATNGSTPDSIIKGLLDREGKRLVVIMDDVERQYDAERTYRALQLVHHAKTMGRDNVQVLCIFEKAALLRAAPSHALSSEEFLEKFSEIEINIAPPNEPSLRAQLEALLSNPQHSKYLPSDFNLELSVASVRDIKSHRGVIRAFNELLLEFISTSDRDAKLELETGEEDVITYVNYTDRFLMGHLKLKYPLIYRDIAEHRDRYTQPNAGEEDIRNMFGDRDELNRKRLSELESLFDEAKLSDEQKDTLKDLLVDLFPALSRVINQSNSHKSLQALRAERRIGHRDVLDAYFALTTSQDAYVRHERWIREVVDNLSDASDAEMMRRFEKYSSRAREDSSEMDSITLLRNELLKQKHKEYQLQAFRAWMRVVLSDTATDGKEDNNALARILSAMNDIAERGQPEKRIDVGRFAFYEVTKYIAKPYSALLLLLFLLPQQGNNYLAEYVHQKAFKQGGLYQRVLKWVDDYFADKQINIYEEYEYEDWAFIAYQWALSSSASGTVINKRVIGSSSRYKRANAYLFSMLNQNDITAFKFLHSRFWQDKTNDRHVDENAGWRVNGETVTPYIASKLLDLAKKIVVSSDLTAPQKRLIQAFIADLETFINDLEA